ncbi:MAG: SLC13 family permease [Solirubrobacterales bacterium]
MDAFDVLANLPLFRGLDRVNLAKLVPELELARCQAGEVLFHKGDTGDSLYIILSGEAIVSLPLPDGGEVEIARLGLGECFGEMALLAGEPRSASVRANQELEMFRLSRDRFDALLTRHHALAIYFSGLLARRLIQTNRKFLPDAGPDPGQELDNTATTPMVDAGEAAEQPRRPLSGLQRWILALGAVVVFLSGYGLHQAGLRDQHVVLVELLLIATVIWMANILPFHLVAMALPLAAVIFKAAEPAKAFAGFASPSWFLALGIFALIAAISRTGLLYRLTLLFLSRFPPGYAGQQIALVLSGLILTPVIPSPVGRSALAGPLALNLAEIQRFGRRTTESAGLGLACLLGFGHLGFLFLNGQPSNFLVLGLMPATAAEAVHWGSWLLAALPAGLVFTGLSLGLLLVFYPAKNEARLDPHLIEVQLQVLGEPKAKEVRSLAVGLLMLAGFATEGFHGIGAAWIALIGFAALMLLRVLDESDIRQEIDWPYLIAFGALIGFGQAVQASGLTDRAAGAVLPLLGGMLNHPAVFLVTSGALMFMILFAVPFVPAIVIGFLTLTPLASAAGIHPMVLGIVLLMSATSWFLPYQSDVLLSLLYGSEGRLFQPGQALPASFGHVVITLIAIALSVPWWIWMGLIQS